MAIYSVIPSEAAQREVEGLGSGRDDGSFWSYAIAPSQREGRHHFHSCRQSSRTDAGSASKSNRRRRRMSKAVAEIAENAEIPFGFLVTEKEQA